MTTSIHITWQLPPAIEIRFPAYVQVPTAPSQPSGNGDVAGPETVVANTLARFSGTTGKLLQGGNIVLDDNGNMSGVRSITITNGTQTITLSVGVNANGQTIPIFS